MDIFANKNLNVSTTYIKCEGYSIMLLNYIVRKIKPIHLHLIHSLFIIRMHVYNYNLMFFQ